MYIRFTAFWSFSKLLFVLHILAFTKSLLWWCASCYGKQSLNQHLQHCAHSVYQIYSVLKLFEITVSFTHFGFYETWTPVLRIMLTKAKLFKSSFRTLRTQCISDLKRFETFRNCCLFCTFWVLRNFYCGEAHHANYGKHSLSNHFQHCPDCVYQIYSVLKLFEITVSFTHFGFYEISTPVLRIMLTKAK